MIAALYDRRYDIFMINKEGERYSEYLSFSEKCFKNSIEQLRKRIPMLMDPTYKEIACVVLSVKLARKEKAR